MRIGYLTYGLDRSPTGIGRYSLELLRSLGGVDNEIELVVLATEQEDAFRLSERFEYHHVPHCRTLPALTTYGNLAIRSCARRYGLDAIHDPNGIAPFMFLNGYTRSIVTLYDAFAFVHPELHNAADNYRYRWYLPYALRAADCVITVSECSRADLIRYLNIHPERIQVITAGVDPRFGSTEGSDSRGAVFQRYGIRQPYLLYVGALNARKNVARMMHAFNRVHSEHPDVHLVIAGKRQWKTSEIDEACRLLEMNDAVSFTGYVDDDDLPTLYAGAEGFLFPSIYEGFGLPVLEAMACGTPVVTSKVSSIPEVTGNAAILVDPYSIDEIAAAISRLLMDRTLRADLVARGRERASLFSWERAAEQTRELYRSVLDAQPAQTVTVASSIQSNRGARAN
jgi:glycosyltransferase involved in cell wall biosynthesis